MQAVFENDTTLTNLLQSGANVDFRDDRGNTALTNSCIMYIISKKKYSLSVVSTLLAYNASVDLKDSFYNEGKTALMYAAMNGNIEVVSALLAHNTSVNMKYIHSGEKALMMAARNNHSQAISTLLA